jgi:hypothetical protein
VGDFATNAPATPGHLFMGQGANIACSSVTWTDKTGNLPNMAVDAVEVNPNNPNQVFVGTMLGFYCTNNLEVAAPVWDRFQAGMPNPSVQQVVVDRGPASNPYARTTLGAFTFGRGAYVVQMNGATVVGWR